VDEVHRQGVVSRSEFTPEGARLAARVPPGLAARLAPLAVLGWELEGGEEGGEAPLAVLGWEQGDGEEGEEGGAWEEAHGWDAQGAEEVGSGGGLAAAAAAE
jgi:hypothetical protein